MLRLDPPRVDSRDSFPVPRDEERCVTGRRIAFQHQAWREELCRYHLRRAYLQACIEARVDPGTGRAPRVAQAWAAIETRARAEVLRMDVTVRAILSDYADHLGRVAAFAAYVDPSRLLWTPLHRMRARSGRHSLCFPAADRDAQCPS